VRVDELERSQQELLEREIVDHPGATAIIAVTSADLRDPDTKVVLVSQYRHAAQEALWEIPAGTLEPGEEILTCAKRELLEETGLQAQEWIPLFIFYTAPGFCNEKMHLYLAKALSPTAPGSYPKPDDEEIEVGYFSLNQIKELILSQQIKDAKSLVGLLWLFSLWSNLDGARR
jgi:ADP-ribose pyrophosphatase